jgi:cytochrome c oxidase cbb3-type subunit I/II
MATAAAADHARMEERQVVYNDWIVRNFAFASVGWSVVGLLLGVVIAIQLAFHQANLGPYLSYGRLRPLHTNAVIFAFVGNMLFAGVYHSAQRLLKARLPSDTLAKVHFWGWQLVIVAAALTLPLGITSGKEYAELEWPIDLAIAGVWVVFGVNLFWTIARRAEKHLYVAIWFYIATVVTVAVLHIVNSLAIPVSLWKSYSIYGGAKDALVQWWYGHNAVAFFLTTPILGIMYYYLPKAAERPVYSYRLSIIHFWALVFLYIWAGPHHLLNTALPEWAQTLGMIFSLMLWAPSWGGMINGLLTLRGAWSKVRTDPVLKFFAAGVTFYGMATFEGPLLSIKAVSGLAHYTDWIVGHVHSGALGWNGFMAAGMFYWLLPRLFGTKLHSTRLADLHFGLGTVGIVLYMVSMWISGVQQGLMWKATNPDGSLLYPSFVETVIAIRPMYLMRLAGGSLYLVGQLLMVYNLWKTVAGKKLVETSVTVTVPVETEAPGSWKELVFGRPVGLALLVVVSLVLSAKNAIAGISFIAVALVVGIAGTFFLTLGGTPPEDRFHRRLEGRATILTAFTIVSVLIGGLVELIPVLALTPADGAAIGQKPYRALELEGRDVYLREGCYTCHSQMIRPFAAEALRYGQGEISRLEDSIWDHPFQWGSKRTGPDLAMEGSKIARSNLWHYQHMMNPREISYGSNMPSYAHMAANRVDLAGTESKVRAMKALGVPYSVQDVQRAPAEARAQAEAIVQNLAAEGVELAADTEMVALIAYLQRLGKKEPDAPEAAKPSGATLSAAQPSK